MVGINESALRYGHNLATRIFSKSGEMAEMTEIGLQLEASLSLLSGLETT